MVDDGESKIGAIPPFALRMQRALRTRVEAAARANRRSVNSEIVARLAQSFDMAALEIDPGDVPTSPTAKEALELARANAERIKFLEDSLLEISSADEFLDVLNAPAQRLFEKLAKNLRRE